MPHAARVTRWVLRPIDEVFEENASLNGFVAYLDEHPSQHGR